MGKTLTVEVQLLTVETDELDMGVLLMSQAPEKRGNKVRIQA